MFNWYYVLATLVATYIGSLLLLNAIPNISVKKFGWLCVKHVTIQLPLAQIQIASIRIRINFSRGEDLALRFIRLDINDAVVTLKDDEKPKIRKESEKSKARKTLGEQITLRLPTRIYDFIVYYRLINQFEIHLIHCTVRHEKWKKNLKFVLDYAKVQTNITYTGNTKLTFIALQSHLFDGKSDARFFRNLELLVEFELVTYLYFGDHKLVYLCLQQLKTSFSIGRLTIPLDVLRTLTEGEPVIEKDINKSVEGEKDVNKRIDEESDSTGEGKGTNAVKTELASFLSEFEPVFDDAFMRFAGISIKLEDFTMTNKEKEVKASNLALTLAKVDVDQDELIIPIEFNVFATAILVLHNTYKSFEMPSTTLKATTDPKSFYKTVIDLANGDTESLNHIDWDTKSIITNPQLHLYYDQLELLQRSENLNTPKTTSKKTVSKKVFDPISIINKLKVFALRFAVVDILVKVHLPKLGSDAKRFNRGSRLNWTMQFTVLALLHRFYTTDFANLSKRRKFKLNFFLQIKSVKIEALGNTVFLPKVSLLASLNVIERTWSIKVTSKFVKARSINDTIFMFVRGFRDNSIALYNEKFDTLLKHKMEHTDIEEGSHNASNNSLVEPAEIDFFKILPSFISQIRVKIAAIETDIICKDGLPSQIIFDEATNQNIDLSDYKRGVWIRLNSIELEYKKKKETVGAFVKTLNCYTISECPSEYVQDFDEVVTLQKGKSSRDDESDSSSLFSEFSVESNNMETTDEEDDASDLLKMKKILHIHDILISNKDPKAKTTRPDKLFLSIPEIDGRIDVAFVWCIMYAITLLNLFAPTVKRKCSEEELIKLGHKKTKINLSICIESVLIVLRLPNAVDIMLELDQSLATDIFGGQGGKANCIRLYVVHPATKLWTRLLVIDKPLLDFKISSILEDSVFLVDAKTIRLNIPHLFLFYTVIDNAITLGKVINQIQHNFLQVEDSSATFEKIWPAVKPAILLPTINLKTRSFGISLENDSFENQLSNIYELGVIEQQIRMKKVKLFEKEAAKIRESAEPDIETQSELTDTLPKMTKQYHYTVAGNKTFHSPLRNIFNEEITQVAPKLTEAPSALPDAPVCLFTEFITKPKKSKTTTATMSVEEAEEPEVEINRPTHSEAEAKIKIARDRLNQNIGTTWIRKFRLFTTVKNRNWKNKFESLWGEDKISSVMTNKFNILNYSEGAALMAGNFRELDLTIKAADIPDVHRFLREYGSNQPTLEYSILVPLSFDLKCQSVNMLLKDYPLPFISFPEGHDKRTTVHIAGRLVVNEQMVRLKEEMRYIFVPFSPAIHHPDMVDNFYAVNIARTLATIKLTADVKCKFDTDRACMISWNKSYQPAILAMSAAFDNFTKPEIDDSPIGWWDKIALMCHGKLTLDIPNELCLHIKSSLSPYETTGRASGFVFSWKNNVHLGINETGNAKEVIRLESDDFVLAIPNYTVGLQQHAHGGIFDTELATLDSLLDYESSKFRKRVVTLSSSERVVWLFGMQFERNKNKTTALNDSEERITEFKNHWDVVITNPAFDYHPDSYEGFRSDYIHMQLSVISKSTGGEAFNAGYLTPLTFSYFFHWWDSLTEGIGLPIRQGKLFNSQSEVGSINTGPHLFTIKYLLVFEPLTISHTYMHNTDTKVNGDYRTAFTGLKGKFKSCNIFMRQRKEYVRYVNERLGINNKVYHLNMHQAEINADVLDLRLINAIFNDRCPMGTLMANFEKSSSNADPKPATTVEFDKWLNTDEVYGDDISWVDLEDFVELERDLLSSNPILKVFPFCYVPNFNYLREFDNEDGKYPFGQEKFGHYNWNVPTPEETQIGFLKKRMRVIEREIRHHKDLLDREAVSKTHLTAKELRKVIAVEEKKLEVIENVWLKFVGRDILAATSVISENFSAEKRLSRTLSGYSSQSRLDAPATRLNYSATKFHNRFIVHNLQLKWNNNLRDLFMAYIQMVGDRKAHVHYMTRKAVELVESVINETMSEGEKVDFKPHVFKSHKTGEEVIDTFEEEIGETDSDQESVNQYLIKLVHPQIQMMSDIDPDSSLLVTSRDLEIRIISVTLPGLNEIISESALVSGIIESRYGVLFSDSHMFVFHKDENNLVHPDLQYGASDFVSAPHWPPWVECEVWYDSSWAQDQLLAERNTMALVYKKPNFLFSEKLTVNQDNEITVHLAKIVLNSTSAQYSTFYYVVTDLLVHTKSFREEAMERLYKIVSLSDSTDFKGLDKKVADLQITIRMYKMISLGLEQYGTTLSPPEQETLNTLEFEMYKKHLELDILMRGVTLRSSKKNALKHESRFWSIMADQLIWHFLDDSREPFVDFAMALPKFTRVEAMDGSNLNEASIAMIQGFNLQTGAKYPELLGPYVESNHKRGMFESHKQRTEAKSRDVPIFKMSWRLLDPIGGIPIMQEAKMSLEPLEVSLDYVTAKRLFEFLFPHSEEEEQEAAKKMSRDGSQSEDSTLVDDTLSRSRNPFRNLVRKRVDSDSSSVHSGHSTGPHSTVSASSKLSPTKSDVSSKVKSEESSKASSNGFSSGGGHSSTSTASGVSSSETKISNLNLSKFIQSKKKKADDLNLTPLQRDVGIIMDRSASYMSIVDVELQKFTLFVSFSAPGGLHVLNVHDLNIQIPTLRYKNKMWSGEDLILRIKKDLIKIMLQHTGKILGNKLLKHDKKRKSGVEPLKQVSNYADYMSLKDLQTDGRSRDAAKTNTQKDEKHLHPRQKAHHTTEKALGDNLNSSKYFETVVE